MSTNYIDRINNEYFEWLCSLIEDDNSFRKLLLYLHDVDFRYLLPRDENRYQDGFELRYRFAHFITDYDQRYELYHFYWDKKVSVLEVLIALALRCETDIMDNPNYGDRSHQWFWKMIINLGLGSMTDTNFDRHYVHDVIERFLNRKYEPDGKGGLFQIKNCDRDLREVEIWYQLCWYLDSIT